MSHELLVAGYRVWGTVRSKSKNAWLTSLLDAPYGSGQFDLIEVPGVSAPEAWNAVVKGVSGIADVLWSVCLQHRFRNCGRQGVPVANFSARGCQKRAYCKIIRVHEFGLGSLVASCQQDTHTLRVLLERG